MQTGRIWRKQTAVEDPICLMAQRCLSCEFINQSYDDSLQKKFADHLKLFQEKNLLNEVAVVPPVPSPQKTQYRHSFKYAVRRGLNEEFLLGLFKPGTHTVVPETTQCPIHVTALKTLLLDLPYVLSQSGLTPFNEYTHQGDVRYVLARASSITQEIMLTFVVTRPCKQEVLKMVQSLRKMRHKINSAHMNINAEEGNAIVGGETVHVAGLEVLRERVGDFDIDIPPTAFFQVNPPQAKNIYSRVIQYIGEPRSQEVAWDLYCGLGQIAMYLAQSGRRVLGIEENPQSIEWARKNGLKNRLHESAEFLAARVEDIETQLPRWAASPQVIVANPSRRGIHETARHLVADRLRQVHSKFFYISCETESLVRDLEWFKTNGIRLRQLESFDMFPYTSKIEWLAVLTT